MESMKKSDKKTKKSVGRPTKFSKTIAIKICELLSTGNSLVFISKKNDMPGYSTICTWLQTNTEFQEMYARARELQADYLAAEIIDISNNPEEGKKMISKTDSEGNTEEEVHKGDMIEHRKIKIDARKWYVSKVLPKKYGNKIEHSHKGVSVTSLILDVIENEEEETPPEESEENNA